METIIKVLLVDDHAILREGIRALLALSKDIEVVGEAGDGQQAIEQVQQLTPDVVLMDIAYAGAGWVGGNQEDQGAFQNVKY